MVVDLLVTRKTGLELAAYSHAHLGTVNRIPPPDAVPLCAFKSSGAAWPPSSLVQISPAVRK